MKHEDIRTESDYWEYCTIYSQLIFVREQVDGKYESCSLEDLSPERRAFHVKRMLQRGIVPTRIRTEEEIEEEDGIQNSCN